nr:DUF4433 domain-containing protein [Sinorhizobium medicae]
MTPPPSNPKIYHIVNVDKLQSIIAEKHLYSDSEVIRRALAGTVIGMSTIKRRRLELPVDCHEGITVGECVPFYFCSRSVMLYVIYRGDNPELLYKGGQAPIIHLEADLKKPSRGRIMSNDAGPSRQQTPAPDIRNSGQGYTGLMKSTGIR